MSYKDRDESLYHKKSDADTHPQKYEVITSRMEHKSAQTADNHSKTENSFSILNKLRTPGQNAHLAFQQCYTTCVSSTTKECSVPKDVTV